MRLAYFNENGKFWCWANEQTVEEGTPSAEINEEIPAWRFTYNFETESVDVYHPEMSISEAEAQLSADLAAELAASAAAET
jgi:hypothetical protein